MATETGPPVVFVDTRRLIYAKLDGPGTTLAYMADDKAHVSLSIPVNLSLNVFVVQAEPLESVFRSMLLVLLDNASAEYLFIAKFFREPVPMDVPVPRSPQLFSPSISSFPDDSRRTVTESESDRGDTPSKRRSTPQIIEPSNEKEQRATLGSIWKQIMDPALQYCDVRSKRHAVTRPADVPHRL